MDTNTWSQLRWILCLVGWLVAGPAVASADGVPDYIGFVSHNWALPNPDRPYEMISGTVHYPPGSLTSLYDLEFQPSNPAQLDVPNRNAEGVWEFDSEFNFTYRAVVSFGLEPPHPITGFGWAHAVGRAEGSDFPFEPLVFETELLSFSLFGLSPIPEVNLFRESPALRSTGVTKVEDACPLCLGPLSTLRISSYFDIYTELEPLLGFGWFPANKAIRVAQYPTPTIAGDYNSNGVVDVADYVVWRDNLGSSFSMPNDDSPGVDGFVDFGDGDLPYVDPLYDYKRWRANFGSRVEPGSAASSAVPEPAARTLLLLAWATVLIRGRR